MLTKINDDLWIDFDKVACIDLSPHIDEYGDEIICSHLYLEWDEQIFLNQEKTEALKKTLEARAHSVHIPTVSTETPFPHPDMVITTNCGGKECQNQE